MYKYYYSIPFSGKTQKDEFVAIKISKFEVFNDYIENEVDAYQTMAGTGK